MPDFPFRTGLRPPDQVRLRNMIRFKFTGVLPAHPTLADHLSRVLSWILGGNDKYGTCGPTSVANFVRMVWKYLLNEDITVTDEQVFDLYRRSGNPDFDPNGPVGPDGYVPGDNGVDMTVMLDALLKGGIDITHADGTVENVKPLCYAAVDVDIESQHAATSIFGGVLWALDLQTAQQSQFSKGLWDYSPSSMWGGHAVLGGAYTSKSGKGLKDVSIVTWKTVIGTTDPFAAHQLAQSFIPVFKPLWDNPAFQAGVDQAALAAAYEAVTGRKFPVPVPPQPNPPPTPGPTPSDGCNLLLTGLKAAADAFTKAVNG